MFGTKNKKKQETFDELQNTLKQCFQEITQNHYNRITINIEELSQEYIDENKKGGWQEIQPYYPEEMLSEKEQKIIEQRKSYQVSSLVNKEVPKIVNYKNQGLEIMDRIEFMALMPKMASSHHYFRGNRVFLNDINTMTNMMIDANITPQELREQFNKGVQEYKEITTKLYEQAGVYDSLQKLESKQTLSDKVFETLKNKK